MADEEVKKEEAQAPAAPTEETKEETAASAEAVAPAAEVPAEDASTKAEVPEQFKGFVDQIEKLSVLELHELVKTLEKHFGVSAAAVAVQGPAVAAEGESDEGGLVNVELTDAGAQKIAVIKVVKEVCGLGLKEAKDLVESAPAMVKEGLKKEEAEEIKVKLEGAGGKVTFK